jgi:hypothetical protein
MLTPRPNFHHSKLPALGALGHIIGLSSWLVVIALCAIIILVAVVALNSIRPSRIY